MSKSEKDLLRSSLDEYIALNPIKVKTAKGIHNKWHLPIYTFNRKAIALTLSIVIVLTSSGATYASADALPGDKLYKVKEITEDIEQTITITDAGQAKLAEKLMKRREMEMQRLEAMGMLDEEHIKTIEKRMAKHRLRAKAILQRIDTQNPKQAEELKKLLKDNTTKLQHAKIKRLNRYFDTEITDIEMEYKNQENLLQELDNAIKEINTVINNY